MLLARQVRFFHAPHIWTAPGKARVYFEPWSQNRGPGIRGTNKMFFSASEMNIYADRFGQRIELFAGYFTSRDFSGSRTRDSFEEAQVQFSWLRNVLVSMS